MFNGHTHLCNWGELSYSKSFLDIMWKSRGYTLQLQVGGAPTLCLCPAGHILAPLPDLTSFHTMFIFDAVE